MEDERLKDKRPLGELLKVKVDVHSEALDFIHSDTRPVIYDRDPKKVNSSLKVTNVQPAETWAENTQYRTRDREH